MVKENRKTKLSDVNSVVGYLDLNKMQISSKQINKSKQKEKTILSISSFSKEKISAANYFAELLKQESFVKKLYVKPVDDGMEFWIVFDATNNLSDRIYRVSSLEQKLWDKYEDQSFDFKIVPDDSDYVRSIENFKLKLFEK